MNGAPFNSRRAIDILRGGGLIVYPTETVYGIGCDPLDADAVARIRTLKGRPDVKPMLLAACSREQAESFTGPLPAAAEKLADRFWPGPLTLIIRPDHALPPWLIGESGGVAVRVTSGTIATELTRAFGRTLVSTSANRSGSPPLLTYPEALAAFGGDVDLVIPFLGKLSGVPSTIVDLTGACPAVVREGDISAAEIHEVL
jgi:L-threonylcarbamoyladenylate synthase